MSTNAKSQRSPQAKLLADSVGWILICQDLAMDRLGGGQPSHSGAAFGSATGSAIHVTGLFVVFPAAHFLLHATVLDQLTKTPDCLLNRFLFPYAKLYHTNLLRRHICKFLRDLPQDS